MPLEGIHLITGWVNSLNKTPVNIIQSWPHGFVAIISQGPKLNSSFGSAPLILEMIPASEESKKFSTKVPFLIMILWFLPRRSSKRSMWDILAVDIILEMKRLPNLEKIGRIQCQGANDKNQCQLCKGLAWPINPHSWSVLVWKSVSPMNVITMGKARANVLCIWPFSAWWRRTKQRCIYGHVCFSHCGKEESCEVEQG